MKKYVITGGASCGKSSVISELELLNEFVVNESAETVARNMNAKGIEFPHIRVDYQPKVLDLFLRREAIVKRMKPERIFYDRGVHEQKDYTIKNGFQIFPKLRDLMENIIYDKVFFLESRGILQETDYRKEKTIEECEEMAKMHLETYKKYGHEIIRVPDLPLVERVHFILERCD